MKAKILTALAALALAAPAFAGDVTNGEKEFKKCKSCHMIVADDGTEIVKGGKTGPNLYGVVGRAAGSVADFAYSDAMKGMGATGLVWDEALLAEYVADPTAFIDSHGGEGKSKMTFNLKKEDDRHDVIAYLKTFSN